MGLYVKDAHVCCESVEHYELQFGVTMTTDMSTVSEFSYRFISNMQFLPFDYSLKLEKYILHCLLIDDTCDVTLNST